MRWSLASMIDEALIRAITRPKRGNASPEPAAEDNTFVLGKEFSGFDDDEPRLVRVTWSDLRRHLYVIGATGCGKTNLLIRLIEHEFHNHRTCVVLDLRGDLVDRILGRLAHSDAADLPGRLKLIDLREDGWTLPFNPLGGLGDPHSRALQLLGVLRCNAESWGVQLEETLRNCLITLAEAGFSLAEIEPLLEDGDFRQSVLAQSRDAQVVRFFERYSTLSPDKQQALIHPVVNKISALLSVPQLRRMVSARQGLDWSALIDRPGTLTLVALAGHRFHSASNLIGGLMVSSLQGAIMARASQPERERAPLTLFVDEFETMASESFQALIAEGRRFGLSLVLSHQNLSQLKSELRQSIRNNVHLQLFFQTGAIDAGELAAEIVSDRSREQVRSALISQGVGEAFVVRRGQPTVQVRTLHSPDPALDAEQIAQVRLDAIRELCVRAYESDRHCSLPAQPSITPKEVRHGRMPRSRKSG